LFWIVISAKLKIFTDNNKQSVIYLPTYVSNSNYYSCYSLFIHQNVRITIIASMQKNEADLRKETCFDLYDE